MAIKYYEKMPVVPLRGLVVMPYTLLSFDAGRDKSVAAIETAAENDGLVFLTAQKDPKLTDITAKQLYATNFSAGRESMTTQSIFPFFSA